MIIHKEFTKDRYLARYLVQEKNDGMRLDQFIQLFMTGFSREDIKAKIKAGDVKILNRPFPHRPSVKVYYKEEVELIIKKTTHEDEHWRGKLLNVEGEVPEVIYEDEDLLVVNKPPFMTTHPTGRHIFYCATVYFEQFHKQTVHSIHRLDRETSGVLLLGKNPKAANKLTENFEKDLVKKCYFFISKFDKEKYQGEKHFVATERLGHWGDGRKRVVVLAYDENSREGKHAKTKFEIVHEEGDYILGLAFPQTGRQHQIRVHAATHGLPLVGDKIYLGDYPMFQRFKDGFATEEDHDYMELPRQALHALAVKFPYRGDGKVFISSLPNDMKSWIEERLTIHIDDLQSLLQTKIHNAFTGDAQS